MKNEVISILVVYYATTLDTDTCHNNYMLDITSQWSVSWCNNITMLCCLHRCIFKLGVSKLTQMAGRENQELECHLLVAISSAEDNEGESLDPCFSVAI